MFNEIHIGMSSSQSISVSSESAPTLPIGTIVLFGGDVIPKGWHLCDGAEISRMTYFSLFLVIGTLYGTGDHIRTFNLPDFRGRFPLGLDNRLKQRSGFNQGGASEITLTEAELPSHTHDKGTLAVDQAGSHTHSLQDPGHNHGGQTGDGPMGGSGRGMVSGGGSHDYGRHIHVIPQGLTGISVVPADNHTHSILGATASKGGGKAIKIINPHQTINYIIYVGPEFSEPSIG
jgi:microcystin-dependent protein